MRELNPLITRCKVCNYNALTWHEDIKKPCKCNKCQGDLEIIAIGRFLEQEE